MSLHALSRALAAGAIVLTPVNARSQSALPAGVVVKPYVAAQPGGGARFDELTPEQTGVSFQMQLPDPHEHIREFTLLSIYGGMCAGDYDGDGLTDFYVTSPVGGGRLFRNEGNFRFRDVTAEAGVHDPNMQGSGATFADVDNDGDLDLYACAYGSANRLFLNQGANEDGVVTFAETAGQLGVDYKGASMTMAFADIDADGDLDGYLATTAQQPPPGTKFSVHYENNRPVVDKAVQEYWDIIYLPNNRVQRTEAGQFDHLYRNDGDHFTEITREAGVDGPYFTLSATWWDYNNDGRPDLYAANDFLGPDRLYRNEGDCRFTEVAATHLPHTPWFSMGTDVADVNNDGLVDLFGTDMSARKHERRVMMSGDLEESRQVVQSLPAPQEMRNALFLNLGGDRPVEAARMYGASSTDWTWTPRLADFDNDGFVDLFVTTGVLRDSMNSDFGKYANASFAPGSDAWRRFWAAKEMRKEPNVALRNVAGQRFEDMGPTWGLDRNGVSYGAVTADFDNDGDLDLVVNNADAPVSIYRNNAGGNSLRIELRGTKSNRFGLGATITCEAAGRRQAAYLTLARGWLSALEPAVHFGLGDAQAADAVTIRWPSGRVQRLENLKAQHVYTITEPEGEPAPASAPPKPLFVEAEQASPIVHQEEPFDDFAAQPLLPFRLSQPGPALASADVDGDGDVDLFLGGARGHSGRLFLNDGKGSLQHAAANFAETIVTSEAAAAVFFDADGDKDQDLYVATGSVEHRPGDPAYRDAIFLNDGGGKFARAPSDALPALHDSGSVVAPADVDQDGDVDLFVGSRSVPGAYPTAPENRLLVNDRGKFAEATPDAVKAAGMVTDACWADIDGDGWLDLAVTTDWGPVRLFKNQKGHLVEATEQAGLASRLGWWLAIAPGDLDADGDLDFVVTNFGRNTPYKADSVEPVELYYGDVEGLGTPRLIEVVREGERRFPRRDFKTLQAALPALSAVYTSFAAYSTATLEEVFPPDQLRQATHLEATCMDSGVLLNNGRGKFDFKPLADLAQLAPASDVAIADINGDDRLDIVLAQNLFTFNSEIGRLDGGLGLVLLGAEGGDFRPLASHHCGVVVPEQARHVAATDLNGDGRPDLVFGTQGPLKVYLNKQIK
jgi:hypothetical protein